MTTPPPIPAWLTTCARTAELVCDAGLIAASILATYGAPLSVATALGPIEWAWVLLVALGGVLSAVGTLTQILGIKLAGCCFGIGGLGAWVSSLLAGDVTSGQGALCFVLIAGASLLAYRMVVTLAVIYLRAAGTERAI